MRGCQFLEGRVLRDVVKFRPGNSGRKKPFREPTVFVKDNYPRLPVTALDIRNQAFTVTLGYRFGATDTRRYRY